MVRRSLPCLALVAALCAGPAVAADAPLPSWSESSARTAILDFVEKVTAEGGPAFVAPEDRVAVFDNDGTLWAEKPMYVQVFFAIDRVKALASDNPGWTTEEPFASILKGDIKAALAGGRPALEKILAATHTDITVDDFADVVGTWLETAKNPEKDRLFTELDYQPMIELLGYLRENGFRTFIVSGGGIDFIRVFSEELYGVAPAEVVGTTSGLEFAIEDGTPQLMKLASIVLVDDGPGKPVGIQQHIGQRPILAFGNSDGDLQMLQYTCLEQEISLCGLIHHTDAVREWAYDKDSSVGMLDEALTAASINGWTVVDMAKDWEVVFAPAQ